MLNDLFKSLFCNMLLNKIERNFALQLNGTRHNNLTTTIWVTESSPCPWRPPIDTNQSESMNAELSDRLCTHTYYQILRLFYNQKYTSTYACCIERYMVIYKEYLK